MSIASEITRLQNAKTDIKTAIENKGVEVPSNATIDTYDTYIEDIPSGGPTPTISGGTSSEPGYFEAFGKPTFDVEGTSCQNMFYQYPGTQIPKVNVTSNVTDLRYMFYLCNKVENYNCEDYDTSNVTHMSYMFYGTNTVLKKLDLSKWVVKDGTILLRMFGGLTGVAILDISNFDLTNGNGNYMFSSVGRDCLQSDGAYADGIPYVYVKDTGSQTWVLTNSNNGHPSSWTTSNVIVKSQN